MFVRVPTLVAALVGIWVVRMVVFTAPASWVPTVAYPIALVLYGAGAAMLVVVRDDVRLGSAAVAAACTVELLARAPVDNNAVILLLWIAAIFLLTGDRTQEQAFLLRACVTTVYAFSAMSKLNPSWLAGEGVVGVELVRTTLGEPAAAAMPAVVVLIEAWLAVGLWFAGTRGPTAALGVLLHVGIVAAVSQVATGALYLMVLNGLLVAMYPAFWDRSGRVIGSAA